MVSVLSIQKEISQNLDIRRRHSDNQNDDGVHSHLVCHRLVQQRRQSSRGQHHCGREVAL